MNYIPDNEIRAEIRSLLVRQRVDQWRLQVRVTGGIVRLTGELVFLRGSDPTPPALVENLERTMNATAGVKRATIDVSNWTKASGYEWKPVEKVVLRPMAPVAVAA